MLPVQTLRALILLANLLSDTSSNYQKFQMTNVELNMSANNGLLHSLPNTANLYQGQWQSNIAIMYKPTRQFGTSMKLLIMCKLHHLRQRFV